MPEHTTGPLTQWPCDEIYSDLHFILDKAQWFLNQRCYQGEPRVTGLLIYLTRLLCIPVTGRVSSLYAQRSSSKMSKGDDDTVCTRLSLTPAKAEVRVQNIRLSLSCCVLPALSDPVVHRLTKARCQPEVVARVGHRGVRCGELEGVSCESLLSSMMPDFTIASRRALHETIKPVT